MGMYTELILGVRLKKDTPRDVIDVLKWLVGDGDRPELPEEFVGCVERPILMSGGSYYFPSEPVRSLGVDGALENYTLTFITNIKNYDQQWQVFLKWLSPHCDYREDIAGYLRYEEEDYPTAVYLGEDSPRYEELGAVN